ncbi:tetratricopeptide repeat protein [Dictyobacter sp. S3.2.2.5]|uniref:Tetratricopeptide repeat protein n=1 Tax=Dictyobacter halimunensis TaxID=3026934 RepID=A0ABQ6FJC8_9CHLR|nr:tetratricopeptide repeat protein [Dictyobacter sp. S3.2.2.5]
MQRNESLRQQRIARNWRQQDVADQLGTTVTAIGRWERGAQQPSAYFRVKLCTLFGKSAAELGLVETIASPLESAEVTQEGNAPAEEISLWTVPYARNPHFTGRDDILQYLGQLLATKQPGEPMNIQQAVLTQTQAISGLGGIGKTQIAIEYAYRARMQGRYQHTMWISAANEETILTSFVELARLFMPTLVKEETNQRTIVTVLLRWLEQCTQPWLLIFDNADNLDLLPPYLPHQGNGHILLTTRANAVGVLASSIEVDAMGILEGTHLLLRRARRFSAESPEEMDNAINLVIALAQFPLAIDQAGAYIEETRCTLRDYLQLYQTHRHALLARRGKQASGYPESVATTWSLSFQRVEEQNPAATEFLRLCAFLAPDHIPEELLTKGAPQWPPTLREAVTNPLRFNQMLETLLAFSLVKRLAEDRTLSVHRLVQAVQIDHLEVEAQRTWSERVVRALEIAFPADPKNVNTWPQCLRYLEQVQVCDELIQRYQLLLPEAADLLDRVGSYFLEHSMYSQAGTLYRRALALREQVWGVEHPQVACSLHHLAVLERANGNYEQAEPLFQRALDIRMHHLGSDHLETATSLHGLASLFESQRRYEQAEALTRQALKIYEQHLGADDLETTRIRHTLGLLYWHQGRFEEVEPLYRYNLALHEKKLGPDHLLTAKSQTWLGNLYYGQGRFAEAERLYKRVLGIFIQHFGPTHFQTAIITHNLSALYIEQGRYQEAEPLGEQALALYEQHLGPNHVHTADGFLEVATISLHLGKYTRADTLAHRALQLHEAKLGPLHSHVVEDLIVLGTSSREQSRYAEAESLLQRVLQINAQAPVMPTVQQRALYEFARLREAQEWDEQAVSLYQQALEMDLQMKRIAHPLTMATRQRLAALLDRLDRPEHATQLQRSQPGSTDLSKEETSTNRREMAMEQSNMKAGTWSRSLPACPHCQLTTEIIKSGKNRSGSQRFHCRACQLSFTPQPSMRKPDQVRKTEALVLAKQGISYRRIASLLGVHHQTVSAWISTPGTSGAE